MLELMLSPLQLSEQRRLTGWKCLLCLSFAPNGEENVDVLHHRLAFDETGGSMTWVELDYATDGLQNGLLIKGSAC
ncbi:hypothetical protein AOLI_G00050300 [Acnodon oligacanthus]